MVNKILAHDGIFRVVQLTITISPTVAVRPLSFPNIWVYLCRQREYGLETGVTGDDSATEAADYDTVADRTITIPAGQSSAHVDFTLTPKQDVLAEGDETISLDGAATGLTATDTSITLTDDDAAPTGITLTLDENAVAEGDATATTVTVTATVRPGPVPGRIGPIAGIPALPEWRFSAGYAPRPPRRPLIPLSSH